MFDAPAQQLEIFTGRKLRKVRTQPLYAAEAFAGAGLFSLGMICEGIEVGQVCEQDAAAVKTLRANIHIDAEVCDATDWTPKVPRGRKLDVLFGGPPCQPFSKLGKRKGRKDPRFLLDEFIRWAVERKPKVVLLENVRGLLEPKNRWIVERWFSEMEDAGYEGVVWNMLSADYGTPQLRPRVVFCAWPKGAKWGRRLKKPPPVTHAAPDQAAELGLLPWTSAFERLTGGCCGHYGLYSCEFLNDSAAMCDGCVAGDHYQEAMNDVAAEEPKRGRLKDHPLFPGWGYEPGTEPTGELSVGEVAMLLRDPSRIRSRHPFVDIAKEPEFGKGIPKTRWLAPTLTASLAKGAPMGLRLEPGATFDQGATREEYLGLRRMTIREAAKLQDVPQWYVFKGKIRTQYRQIGNGVPINLGRAIARHILRAFGRKVPRPQTLATDPHSGLWTLERGSNGCTGYRPNADVLRWREAWAAPPPRRPGDPPR